MTWWALDVKTAPASHDAVATWLVTKTGQAVEERDDGMVIGFAPTEEVARTIEHELAGAFPGLTVALRDVEPVDWSTRWRDGISARKLGRLTLSPSWLDTPHTDIFVTLDPETAFGSGEHGSTRGALVLLDRFVQQGDRVLDLGTGSGILAIAAVKLGADQAVGIEIDAEALPIAAANIERNAVTGRVALLHGDAAQLAPLCAPVDLVVSNILRGPNTELLPVIAKTLKPGGIAIFAGMESRESTMFRPVLYTGGYVVRDELVDAGWWAVAASHG
jgi:ribosomal protein L11 methyltransferase